MVPPARRTRTRLAATAVAVVGTAAFAGSCVSAAGDRTAVTAVGAAALVPMLAGVTLTPRLVMPAVLLLGAAYAVALESQGGGLHPDAALYSAGLLAVAEAAYGCWRPIDEQRWWQLLTLAAGTLLLGALILALAALPLRGGVAAEAAGAAAVIVALTIVAAVTRRAAR